MKFESALPHVYIFVKFPTTQYMLYNDAPKIVFHELPIFQLLNFNFLE